MPILLAAGTTRHQAVKTLYSWICWWKDRDFWCHHIGNWLQK